MRLFGVDRVEGYPIVCAAEMYSAPDGNDGVWLDFFLINNSGAWFDSRIDLTDRLKMLIPDPDLALSPDIRFTVEELLAERFRTTDEMEQAAAAFNRGKGEATVSFADDGKAVIIHFNSIGPYNVLKVTVAIDGFEVVIGEDRGLVPLIPIGNLDAVFERCYTVGD